MAVTPPPTTTWWYEFVAALIEHARTRGYALPKLESSIDRTFVHLVTYTSWCICVSGSDSFPIRFQSSRVTESFSGPTSLIAPLNFFVGSPLPLMNDE